MTMTRTSSRGSMRKSRQMESGGGKMRISGSYLSRSFCIDWRVCCKRGRPISSKRGTHEG